MKTLTLQQGSPEWDAHRARHWNASDAPVMLGASSLMSRRELLRAIHGGVPREFSDYVQKNVIDPGHLYEAKARALAEAIVGEELYPCVGTADDSMLSASYDGLTLLNDTVFEHKRLNQALRDAMVDGCTGADLPEMYRVQMEQQCLIAGAERALFMASDWDGDSLVEERHCWYTPDPALRARLLTGWEQFQADLATYVPDPDAAPAPVGRAPDQLPALRIELQGMVTESNLHAFRDAAIAVFKGISTDLQTDQDFADAAKTVKWCEEIEDQLQAAKQHALSQTASIDELFRAVDAISAEARAKRLELDKLVKHRKEAIKGEIVAAGAAAVRTHFDAINANLGAYRFNPPQSLTLDLGAAIKGMRSITAMRDAVDAAATSTKIEASQRAERIRANIAILEANAEHRQLFADAVALAHGKAPEDLQYLVDARIREHEQREAERLEKERERIRQEEAERLEREQRAAEAAKAAPPANEFSMPPTDAKPCGPDAGETIPMRPAANGCVDGLPSVGGATIAPSVRIKLGDINAALAPLSITADGLTSLGFKPVASRGAAKLYAGSDFPRICEALASVIARAPAKLAEQREAA